jgi:hypothetical protein
MLGDAHDLAAIIAWVEQVFWLDQEDPVQVGVLREWPYPQTVRQEIAEALIDLCRCFDNAEQALRREYSQTGNKGTNKVRFTTACFGIS